MAWHGNPAPFRLPVKPNERMSHLPQDLERLTAAENSSCWMRFGKAWNPICLPSAQNRVESWIIVKSGILKILPASFRGSKSRTIS
jgi:hypothetical protein